VRVKEICLSLLLAAAAVARPCPAMATASLTPATVTFGTQVVGTSSLSQPITLSNTGTATVSIAKLTVSGDFSQTNTCGGDLAGNTSCTINVIFTPTTKGLRRGTISVFGNGLGNPRLVHLSGTGTQVKLSVDALNFQGQPIRNPSNPQVVTMTNVGSTPLRIAAIRITPAVTLWGSPLASNVSSIHRAGQFTTTNGCGASLAQGASCTISVTFAPRKAGNATEWLLISDDGGGSPQRVTLWGIGLR